MCLINFLHIIKKLFLISQLINITRKTRLINKHVKKIIQGQFRSIFILTTDTFNFTDFIQIQKQFDGKNMIAIKDYRE